MKIFVKTKPNSKKPKLEKIDENHFSIWVKEAPQNGMANKAVAMALAEFFKISYLRVVIISGHTSKNKVFDVL